MCPEQTVTYVSERSLRKIKDFQTALRGRFCLEKP
jgi:hypothetical protein